MKERIEWLDRAKGIGIVLVVLGHLYPGDSVENVFLYSFHVPLFFFVAGYLFEQDRFNGYKDFLFRMMKTRLIPYISFFAISYVLFIIKVSRSTGLDFSAVIAVDGYRPLVLQPLLALFFANGAWLEKIGNVALWFLPCLFVTESLFFLIVRTGGRNRLVLGGSVLVLALAGFLESVYAKWNVPWSLDTACTAVVFVAMGYGLRGLWAARGELGVPRSAPRKSLAAAAAFAATAVFALLNGRVDMNTNVYHNAVYYFSAAFAGIYAVMVLSQMLPANRLLSWLGRNSLVLFGLHLPMGSFAVVFITAAALRFAEWGIILPKDVYVVLAALVTLLMTAVWVYVLNGFLPFLLGKGGRRSRPTLSC